MYKSRIKIPEHITDPMEKRKYVLSKGECITGSDLFEGFKKLKDKCEVTFCKLQSGNSVVWGVGPHKKSK